MNTVWVGGLPEETTEEELQSKFAKECGQITSVAVRQKSEGTFAFIRFKDPLGFEKSLKLDEDSALFGQTINVRFAKNGFSVSDQAKGKGDGRGKGDVRDGRDGRDGGKGYGKREPPRKQYEPCKVWVGGLHPEVTESELRHSFKEFGNPKEIRIVNRQKDTFAFITYSSERSVDDAIAEMDGSKELGEEIKVNRVILKPGSRPDGRGADIRAGGVQIRLRSRSNKGAKRGGSRDRDRPARRAPDGGYGYGDGEHEYEYEEVSDDEPEEEEQKPKAGGKDRKKAGAAGALFAAAAAAAASTFKKKKKTKLVKKRKVKPPEDARAAAARAAEEAVLDVKPGRNKAAKRAEDDRDASDRGRSPPARSPKKSNRDRAPPPRSPKKAPAKNGSSARKDSRSPRKESPRKGDRRGNSRREASVEAPKRAKRQSDRDPSRGRRDDDRDRGRDDDRKGRRDSGKGKDDRRDRKDSRDTKGNDRRKDDRREEKPARSDDRRKPGSRSRSRGKGSPSRGEPKSLRIENLPSDMTLDELRQTAEDFGEVISCKISKHAKDGGRTGIIEYSKAADMKKALAKLDNRRVEGWEQRLKALVHDP